MRTTELRFTMTEQLGYDKTSIASIFAYSQKLIGHSLRELVSEEERQASNLQGQGKGGLGQMIEELPNVPSSTNALYRFQGTRFLYTDKSPTNPLNRQTS